jgi:hypothetical protein
MFSSTLVFLQLLGNTFATSVPLLVMAVVKSQSNNYYEFLEGTDHILPLELILCCTTVKLHSTDQTLCHPVGNEPQETSDRLHKIYPTSHTYLQKGSFFKLRRET